MEPKNRSELEGFFSGGDLTTLVDLQKFLSEELAQGAERGVDFSRAFTPLTDGLGLKSGAVQAGPPVYVPPVESLTEFRTQQPKQESHQSVARSIVETDLEVAAPPEEDFLARDFDATKNPPPVPEVQMFRRFLAGLMDQCFVFTAWLLTLAITSNAISGSGGDVSSRFLRQFSDPAFLQSALLEYFVIWLGYLVFSLGFLEMTFGMWVWGIRVSFGEQGRFWKKAARVLMSWLICPFVAPSVFLLFQSKGKNLIDGLTHTELYRS